ncbi:non-ribosomal peptide synthetase [Streptomyces huiliensis]|uniref:non-ribosomal peptide synthetase n=1 Tax=Streptomyces huiliensis TaxID=2876027 RepID=UPI001CBBD332|nr:non-ribosomal peptide synthetase [Streptomyces huiliensis]MBZ4322159.1 amino acid adenylation domain-containing protein [Streptomyces huiliensis]
MTRTEDQSDPTAETQRRELAELLLAEAGLAGPDPSFAPVAVHGDDTGAAPLSSAERRMWFLRRLQPDGVAYNLCGGVRLTGPLDPAALGTALTALADAHDILRTVYPADTDGSPGRRVLPPAPVPLPLTDLEDVPVGERAARARAAVAEEGRRPFDLDAERPVRFRLFRFAADDHLLSLTVHHIAFDDLSWGRVLDELAHRYTEATGGAPAPVTRPRVQYADYARWEADRLAEGAWDGQLAHWRERLLPHPPALALPADRDAAPGTTGTDGVRRDARLGPDAAGALRALARESGVTLYTALLAAYQTALHRWTGEDDIAVGSPVVNRGRAEFEDVVGNFGNTVVLRADLAGDPSFRTLLGRVRDVCADAFAHQDVPFDRVTEALRPAGAVGQPALFDAVFSFVTAEPSRVRTPEVLFEELPHHNGTARFPLVLEAREAGGDVVLGLTARADLFSPAAVERLLGHLVELFRGAAFGPDRRLGELPLLTGEEERRALEEWSRTHDDPAETRPLHRLVEEQAARTPDLVAVVARDASLTYRELDARADELAVRLRTLGAGPEHVVGVHLTRSPTLVVALLAVLKAGAAFMPLEPSWPALRRADVARAARPVLVLTDAATTPAPPPLDVPVLDLAEPYEPAAAQPVPAVDMENLAYVIHTSGSTGTPKGVMIRHQAISGRLVWQSRLLGMTTGDRVLHKAPMGFDISVNEIFLPLVNGARLVLADPDAHGDIDHLAEVIEREGVTFLYIVASMLDVLLERDDISRTARSIRHLWCGGEALTPALYRRFRDRLGATMYHGYGPAEATIGVSCHVFDERADGATVTIGRPNPNARLYLLDRALRPVPVGVPGELYLGGMPLARGYLNDPRRTAEAFVPDPFADAPGGRLYRTGDLGRYRPDGGIEFLGRADDQVKVRGFRVELGEVEAALTAHPAVRQSAALLRTGAPGGDRLAAWCVPEAGTEAPSVAALRDWLTARLPHYAVPGELHVLPALPLTSAGKTDRRALLALAPAAPDEAATPFVRPRDALERDVAAVWAELLGRDDIGVRHNFFDLGGHSLLLVRAQALYRSRLGHDVPLVELYDHPTVASLAARMSRGTPAEDGGGPELDRIRAQAERRRQTAARRAAAAGRTARQRAQAPGERTR